MSSSSQDDNAVFEEARAFVRRVEKSLEGADELGDDVDGRIRQKLNDLRHCIEEEDPREVRSQLEELRSFAEKHLELAHKSALREYAESIGLAIIFALFLRGFVIEAFKIPTGSMIPTLLVGDHLFVNKFIYGVRVPFTETYLVRFNEPSRGEVVVFTFPVEEANDYLKAHRSQGDCISEEASQHEKDFIKRVVAVEGDTVELKNNQLYIDGEAVRHELVDKETTGSYLYPHSVTQVEKLGGHRYKVQYKDNERDFGPVKVKEDHVFVMGDNRDNSSDSRCWGQVPIENIKGRAMFIWWSVDPRPGGEYRWGRIGTVIH